MPRRTQDRPQPHYVSQSGDEQIWARVLDTKRRACAAIQEQELKCLFKDVLPALDDNDDNDNNNEDANHLDLDLDLDLDRQRQRLEELLTRHFQTASNPDVSPGQRRDSWTLVRNVLHRIDGKPVETETVTMTNTTNDTTNGEVATASMGSSSANSNSNSNSNSKLLQRVDLSSEAPPRASASSQAATLAVSTSTSTSISTSQAERKMTAGEAATAARHAKMPKSKRTAGITNSIGNNGGEKTATSTTTTNTSAPNSPSKKTGLTASLLAGVQATDKLLATATTTTARPRSNSNSNSNATSQPRPLSPNHNAHPDADELIVAPPDYQRTSNVVAVAASEKQKRSQWQSQSFLESSSTPAATSIQNHNNHRRSAPAVEKSSSSQSSRPQSQSPPPRPASALTSRTITITADKNGRDMDHENANASDMDISDPEPPSETKAPPQPQQRPAAANNHTNTNTAKALFSPLLQNGQLTVPAVPAAAATLQDFAPPGEKLKEQQQQQQQQPLVPRPPPKREIVFPKVASEWNPVVATPKIANAVEEAKFAPDSLLQYNCSPFSGALHPRHALTARFRKQIPSLDMSRDVGRRLAVWDPYWRTDRILSCGLSSPVDATQWRPPPGNTQMVAPHTVVSCSFHLTPELIKLVQPAENWGNANLAAAKDGESRLILRMLPLQAQTKKRADCHLWPKGTFCAIDGGAAQRLYQRKQQSHDHDKWLGMCKHLDMTSVIPATPNGRSRTHTMQVALMDVERYFFCISVCTFCNADTITKSLLYPAAGTQPYLQKLTLEESIEKAMAMITQPIIMDDLVSSGDEDVDTTNAPKDVGKLVFTLTCPLSKALMKIPVRGRCCKHWQCFDLNNYLSYNVTVSGGRWRCASCEKFLSYQDLQLCGLTEAALQKYGKQASSTRDRVEFRGNDQTFHLLEENRRRYSIKRPLATVGSNGDAGKNSSQRLKQHPQEVMEIIID